MLVFYKCKLKCFSCQLCQLLSLYKFLFCWQLFKDLHLCSFPIHVSNCCRKKEFYFKHKRLLSYLHQFKLNVAWSLGWILQLDLVYRFLLVDWYQANGVSSVSETSAWTTRFFPKHWVCHCARLVNVHVVMLWNQIVVLNGTLNFLPQSCLCQLQCWLFLCVGKTCGFHL